MSKKLTPSECRMALKEGKTIVNKYNTTLEFIQDKLIYNCKQLQRDDVTVKLSIDSFPFRNNIWEVK